MSHCIRFAVAFGVVFGSYAVAGADELTKGTIRGTNADPAQVTLKGVVNDTTYNLIKEANVWLDGRSAKLTDLKADDQAVVRYTKSGQTLMANDVRALRNAKEANGTIRSIAKDPRQVVLKGTIKDTTYELDKEATVFVDGKRQTLAELRDGDEVLITYVRSGDRWVANDVTLVKRPK